MSESGSEADAAAHDFMGFDPRHGQAASRADTRRSHAVADDLLDELAAQPSSGTAGSPWGSRVAAWSHQRCCRLSYLRMDLRAPAAPPHLKHAQHLHPRSRCRDCGNASTGAACARLRWQWRVAPRRANPRLARWPVARACRRICRRYTTRTSKTYGAVPTVNGSAKRPRAMSRRW